MDQPDHDPEALAFVGELMETSFSAMPPLTVHVDIVDLLDHFHNDEQLVFEFIGKLKDLLA